MEHILWGDYSSVLLNGKSDAYFECKKSVRQCDPLSPYIFLLAVEGLHKILEKNIYSGSFWGFGAIIIIKL
jgi:hypothetical protein